MVTVWSKRARNELISAVEFISLESQQNSAYVLTSGQMDMYVRMYDYLKKIR